MDIELVHAKLNSGQDMDGESVYQLDLAFGIPFVNDKGKHIGKTKVIHMGMINGMRPDDFVVGLRSLANHIEETVINSDEFNEKPKLSVVDNSG